MVLVSGLKSNSRFMEWWAHAHPADPEDAPPSAISRNAPVGSFIQAMAARHPEAWAKAHPPTRPIEDTSHASA
jgi:hypothetical protein